MSLETEQLNELHWLMEMLHNIDVGLVVLDREYSVQIWNGFMENHSGLLPREVKDKVLFDLFEEIPQDWFKRKAESVFLLKNKAFTIWEQRPYLFKFQNYRPVTGTADFMYQNSTFIPLQSSTGDVTHLCLIIYDVTDSAVNKQELEKLTGNLKVLSQTDGLTNLYNRGYWEQCLNNEFNRWKRSENPSSLVMIDIDNFKLINDNYGHTVGDSVIKHLAKQVKSHIRTTDTAGRYGGEEFAVILSDTQLKNAYIFAERLRKSIAAAVVIYNEIEIKYNISIGIAEVNIQMKNYEAWVMLTDKALYKAKESGRNMTCLSS